MTRLEYLAALRTLGWTVRGLARLLDLPPSTVQSWTRPGCRVPPNVAAWLERRLQAMRDDPPPKA